MKHKLIVPTVFVISVLLVSLTSAAVFAKYDGIDGESKDSEHKEWIDVLSVQHSMDKQTNPRTGSVRARGKTHTDIVMEKKVDKASPKIMEALASGKVIPSVQFDFTRPLNDGRVSYYTYELTNVRVVGYVMNSSNGDDRPTEHVTLNFEKIKTEYSEYDDSGRILGVVEFIWDFIRNRA